jgi:S-adenosylmethionine hydrolase
MRPVITLLTDFGTRDHYVAAMKGVILSNLPEATLVDISHEVGPQDVFEAAWLLEGCRKDFPAGTVHLAVVDPGVGSGRRAIAVRAAGQVFVGPDNGLFSFVIAREEVTHVREIRAKAIVRADASPVFHGRDIFAPAAAELAGGFDFKQIGPPVDDPKQLVLPVPELEEGTVRGEVIHIDRFGNLITNIPAVYLSKAGIASSGMSAEIAGRRISTLVEQYAAAPADQPVVLVGSRGLMEVAYRNGSAARALGVSRGDKVVIKRFV